MKRSLIDGILVTETVAWLQRLQMVDKLVLAGEAISWNAMRASVDVAEKARGQPMNCLDMASQVTLAGVVSRAYGVAKKAEETPATLPTGIAGTTGECELC